MKELAPGYKPTTIGHEALPVGIESSLLSSEFAGIKILTDSADLHSQLSIVDSVPPVSANQPPVTFRYTTDLHLPLSNAAGTPLRSQSKIHPGDIYANPDLRDFYFQGYKKLGTLASMAYGIRALHAIKEDELGLHSSLILDQETEGVTLLVGRNHIGKSAIGQSIENTDERFLMIADDWSEVNLGDGSVTPVSKIFSPDSPSHHYQLAFTSFGKPFYTKSLPADLPPLTLCRIVELHDGGEEPEASSFILRSLTHVPFIKQPLDKDTFADDCQERKQIAEEIASRKGAILSGYHVITQEHETHAVINDHSRDSLSDMTEKVMEIMR